MTHALDLLYHKKEISQVAVRTLYCVLMNRILLSGSIAYDQIMDLPGFFKDYFLPEKLHNINVSFVVPDHEEHFGGTAANVAYSLALLGEKPTIVATVGNDFERYKKYLESVGISTESIHVDPHKKTSFAYIVTDKGDNQISAFHPGAGAVPYGQVSPGDGAIALISAGCLEDIRSLPDVYRGHGTRFLFDPGQTIPALTADDIKNGMTDATAVFLNDYEFELVKVATGWREAEIIAVAQTLVVTLGATGSRVITKDGETTVKAVFAKDVVDPTGAGDAYRAGYIKGMTLGWPAPKCAQLGSTVAAYCVEHAGTQAHTFTKTELQERYAATYGETIEL